jgi:tetratricopeptide (TPR) repeat protein
MTTHRTHALTALAASAAVAMLGGCWSTPGSHSAQVRNEARDRYDHASAQVAYDQARQSFQSGQFEQALGNIDRAIVRFPKESSYFLLRGRILHEMARVDQAREAFEKSAELDPKKPEPHYFLGVIHQRWRENDVALKEYAEAAKLDPSKLHYVAAEIEMLTIMGRHDEAEQRLATVQQRFEFSPVIDRLRADVAKVKGDHAACASLLERAAMRETSAPDVIEELAYARYSKGDWQGSLNALDDPALAKVRARPDLVRLRARDLLLLGRPAEARDALLAIRSDNDPKGRTMLLLGHAAWRLGDWGRVRECGDTLVRLHPQLAEGYMFLGAAAHASGRADESVAMFEQAVSRDPEREITRKLLGEATAHAKLAPRAPADTAAAGAVRSDAP